MQQFGDADTQFLRSHPNKWRKVFHDQHFLDFTITITCQKRLVFCRIDENHLKIKMATSAVAIFGDLFYLVILSFAPKVQLDVVILPGRRGCLTGSADGSSADLAKRGDRLSSAGDFRRCFTLTTVGHFSLWAAHRKHAVCGAKMPPVPPALPVRRLYSGG